MTAALAARSSLLARPPPAEAPFLQDQRRPNLPSCRTTASRSSFLAGPPPPPDMDRKPSTRQTSRNAERRFWTTEENETLLCILEELVTDGECALNGTFKAGAIDKTEAAFTFGKDKGLSKMLLNMTPNEQFYFVMRVIH